jgi:hypothetical protein
MARKKINTNNKTIEMDFYPQIEEYFEIIPNLDKNFGFVLNKIIENSIENDIFVDIIYKTLNSNDLQKFKTQYKKILERKKDFIKVISENESENLNAENKNITKTKVKNNISAMKKEYEFVEEPQIVPEHIEIENEKSTSGFESDVY